MSSFVTKETFDRTKASLAGIEGDGVFVLRLEDADRLFTADPDRLLLRQAIRQQIQSPTVQKIIRDNHRRLKARYGK